MDQGFSDVTNASTESTESSPVEQTTQTDSNLEANQENQVQQLENQEKPLEEEVLPFGNHPRFKEIVNKNRTLESKVKEYERQLQEREQQQETLQQEIVRKLTGKDASFDQTPVVQDQEVTQLFQGLPVPEKFKDPNAYKDFETLYSDFRNQLYKDLKTVGVRQQQQEEAYTSNLQNQLQQIKQTSFGGNEQEFNNYITYSQELFDEGVQLDAKGYLALYNKSKAATNAVNRSNVSGSNRPRSQATGPTAKQIGSMDMDQLADFGMAQLGNN